MAYNPSNKKNKKMPNSFKSGLIVLNLLAIAGYFSFSVFQKERIMEEGELVLINLAPVDPRSLMQGDYMELQYAIDPTINTYEISKRGYGVLVRDSANVFKIDRLQQHSDSIASDELVIKYSLDEWRIKFGAESYFFQEGQAEKYETAKYGGLRVDNSGNSVLIGLYDSKGLKIE